MVALGLTGEVGRIVLRATAAGPFRVRIDRIGQTGMVTEPIRLAPGETVRREITLAPRPTQLPPLVARGGAQCGGSSERCSLAVALWEEIRKAPTANLITQRGGQVPLHLRDRRVRAQHVRRNRG